MDSGHTWQLYYIALGTQLHGSERNWAAPAQFPVVSSVLASSPRHYSVQLSGRVLQDLLPRQDQQDCQFSTAQLPGRQRVIHFSSSCTGPASLLPSSVLHPCSHAHPGPGPCPDSASTTKKLDVAYLVPGDAACFCMAAWQSRPARRDLRAE